MRKECHWQWIDRRMSESSVTMGEFTTCQSYGSTVGDSIGAELWLTVMDLPDLIGLVPLCLNSELRNA